MKNNVDIRHLADGYEVLNDPKVSGVNKNEIIAGPTFSGKTFSYVHDLITHNYTSSLVVPTTKKAVKDTFKKLLEERGFDVIELDFTHPEESEVGFNPLDNIKNEEDCFNLAEAIVKGVSDTRKSNDDYWIDSPINVFACVIGLEYYEAKAKGQRPSLRRVYEDLKNLNYDTNRAGEVKPTSLDARFNNLGRIYKDSTIPSVYRKTMQVPIKTGCTILSSLQAVIGKIFTPAILDMADKDNRVDFKGLGEKKTVLFIRTSPISMRLNNYINIVYSEMLRVLFDVAESQKDYCLKIPVHMIFDDFACGARVDKFDQYISFFRSAGISVTLLIQSESQLRTMYGEGAAQTIIDNCDTYIYMGGSDVTTCERIARKINKPIDFVANLPLKHVIVMRRGQKPFFGKRYSILEDPVYKEMVVANKKMEQEAIENLEESKDDEK